MGKYTADIQDTYDLLNEMGQSVIVRRRTDGAPADPTQPWIVGAPTVVDVTTKGIRLPLRNTTLFSHSMLPGEEVAFIAAKGITALAIGDVLVFSEEWAIVDFALLAPTDDALLYECVVKLCPRA